MLLHAPSRVMAMFNNVGFTVSRTNNPPGTSEGKFEIADMTSRGIRPNGVASKDSVIAVVHSGGMPTLVDQFTMPGTVFGYQ